MNKVLKYILPGFLLCAAVYLSLVFFGPQKLSLEEAYADPEVMAFLTESGRLNELPIPNDKNDIPADKKQLANKYGLDVSSRDDRQDEGFVIVEYDGGKITDVYYVPANGDIGVSVKD